MTGAARPATGGQDGADGAAEPAKGPGAWLRRRPWLPDLAVVLAVFAYNLPLTTVYLLEGVPRFAAVTAVSVLLCAPYPLRRRHPLGVFGVMLAAAAAQPLLGADLLAADIMLAFALYNLATRFRWPVTAPAAAAVVAWLLVAAAPLLDRGYLSVGGVGVLVLVVVWAWTWGTLVRIRREHIAGLRERARQLEREKEAQARIAAAEERARIAREIHDIVAHSLSVVVLMSDGAASKVRGEPERAEQAMLAVRDTGRGALAEMRRLLGVLREDEPGSHAPQPGIGRLGRLVEESRSAGLPVGLTVRGEPAEVPAGLDLAVYRVVQEALTNVRKHAGPLSAVDVGLHYRGGGLEVRVADDGAGPRGDGESGGHGLVGMRERVAGYGGTLRAGARPGGGFEVLAVLPIEGAR
ncbi:sensor histidine kinase [Allonocardiopsis opalescens]|uniref:histidine kinase n=1 Tax=Allonocardiopsis opalescens TaxID=1144618 RepID=A0A2T0Q7E8_9ACTN|nr:histidine kinase [Allonocardiopsis opalescens]PRX99711.1 signal transduction histidine kinase [Allonocardiopsis opalescens]